MGRRCSVDAVFPQRPAMGGVVGGEGGRCAACFLGEGKATNAGGNLVGTQCRLEADRLDAGWKPAVLRSAYSVGATEPPS